MMVPSVLSPLSGEGQNKPKARAGMKTHARANSTGSLSLKAFFCENTRFLFSQLNASADCPYYWEYRLSASTYQTAVSFVQGKDLAMTT